MVSAYLPACNRAESAIMQKPKFSAIGQNTAFLLKI